MLPHLFLTKQEGTQVGPQHRHHSHSRQSQHRYRRQSPVDLPAYPVPLSQGGGAGQPGHQDQAHGPQKHRGQGQHGQGHTAHHPQLGHCLPTVHAALHQLPGDERGIYRPHQVAKQGVCAHRQGDGQNPSAADLPGLPGTLPPKIAQAAVVQDGQGQGGEHLTDHHARHDQTRRPLRILGKKADQKAQHCRCPHSLLQQLGHGGGAHQPGPIEYMFM